MKKSLMLIIAAVAVIGASCGSSADTPPPAPIPVEADGGIGDGAVTLPAETDAEWGTVAYYRFQLDQLGLSVTATDGGAVSGAREMCALIEATESNMYFYNERVSHWMSVLEQSREDAEDIAVMDLEQAGYDVVTTADAAAWRDQVVEELSFTANAVSGSTGTASGEAWAQQLAILGGCSGSWYTLVQL